jgi:hypothetical protein
VLRLGAALSLSVTCAFRLVRLSREEDTPELPLPNTGNVSLMIAVGLIESELNPAEVELLGARAVSYQILAIARSTQLRTRSKGKRAFVFDSAS